MFQLTKQFSNIIHSKAQDIPKLSKCLQIVYSCQHLQIFIRRLYISSIFEWNNGEIMSRPKTYGNLVSALIEGDDLYVNFCLKSKAISDCTFASDPR
jgi:hypothetical protein